MNWNAAIRTLCLIALSAFGCWALVHMGRAAEGVEQASSKASSKIPDLQKTVDKANSTLDAINAPCTGFHGSVTCGPLAQLSQTEKNVGILAGQSALQVRQTGALVTAVAQNLDTVGDSVKQTAAHLNKTADAATELTQGLADRVPATLDTANSLLRHSDAAMGDLDALLKDHAIHETLDNLQVTTQNIGGITADLRQVSDKETADFLKPVKWYMVPAKRAGEFIDIGAAIARNFP